MQIAILINDREYRDALVERLASYDNDLLVNVINGKDSFSDNSLILTDIRPETLEKDLLLKLRPRTIFLTPSFSQKAQEQGFHLLFKYCSVADIISEASIVYRDWHGIGFERNHSAKIISVFCENDSVSYDKCMTLARQIVYRIGHKVLVVSLSYINDYGCDEAGDSNRFARMMYSISTGRGDAVYGHTYTDSYGISALMLQKGKNPLAYLGGDELMNVTSSMASIFDSLIFDIGTCYREQNLTVSENSDNLLFFESGRRQIDIEKILSEDAVSRLIKVKQCGDTEEAMAIDDIINKIYGLNTYEIDKS